MYTINKNSKTFSGMVGVSDERADYIHTVIICQFYISWSTIIYNKDKYPKDVTNIVWEEVLQAGFSKIDENNIGEVFYLGFKYEEFVENSIAGRADAIFYSVKNVVGEVTDLDEIIKIVLPNIGKK